MKHVSKKSKHRQSLYSIEFGPSIDSLRSCRSDTILDFDDNMLDDRQLSPKPMTPRRVKRRSVMTRGTNSRQSTTSRRSHTNTNPNRTSTRSSRRKYHNQNPVTKLMEQQQQQLQQQQSKKKFASFHHNENPSLTASNLLSFNTDMSPLPPPPQPPPLMAKRHSTYNNFSQNIAPDPIYYNMGTMNNTQWTTSSTMGGHYNPTYQHSTPNLLIAGSSNALDNENEHVDDLYNNRPPSVRSSYSNFHGTRPLSSYNASNHPTENVFAELTQQIPPLPPLTSHHHRNLPPPMLETQNIPLSRRSASRESIRAMAFINSGPPAYNLNYHTPPDSETTM